MSTRDEIDVKVMVNNMTDAALGPGRNPGSPGGIYVVNLEAQASESAGRGWVPYDVYGSYVGPVAGLPWEPIVYAYDPTPILERVESLESEIARLRNKLKHLESVEEMAHQPAVEAWHGVGLFSKVMAFVRGLGGVPSVDKGEATSRFDRSMEALAQAYDRESIDLSQAELDELYDDSYFEAIELQRELP